jgi:hypothetical protein
LFAICVLKENGNDPALQDRAGCSDVQLPDSKLFALDR